MVKISHHVRKSNIDKIKKSSETKDSEDFFK